MGRSRSARKRSSSCCRWQTPTLSGCCRARPRQSSESLGSDHAAWHWDPHPPCIRDGQLHGKRVLQQDGTCSPARHIGIECHGRRAHTGPGACCQQYAHAFPCTRALSARSCNAANAAMLLVSEFFRVSRTCLEAFQPSQAASQPLLYRNRPQRCHSNRKAIANPHKAKGSDSKACVRPVVDS
jgi:hypothetical protein